MNKITHPESCRNSMSRSSHGGFFAACAGLLFLGLITPEKAQARTGAFGNQPQIVWMLKNT